MSDRSELIRTASQLPKGDPKRREILEKLAGKKPVANDWAERYATSLDSALVIARRTKGAADRYEALAASLSMELKRLSETYDGSPSYGGGDAAGEAEILLGEIDSLIKSAGALDKELRLAQSARKRIELIFSSAQTLRSKFK